MECIHTTNNTDVAGRIILSSLGCTRFLRVFIYIFRKNKSSAMTLKNHDAINQSLKKCLVKKDPISFHLNPPRPLRNVEKEKEKRSRKGDLLFLSTIKAHSV